ncbi:MAG: phospholipid carrier-dependent glycosyltransferase [Verrucomicrobiota bacterium]
MDSTRRMVLRVLPFLLIGAFGVLLRVHSFEPIHGVGFDEELYANYVDAVGQRGLWHYPAIIDLYLKGQSDYPIALLPPTRVTFIVAATAWKTLFGGPAVEAVRAVSCTASILTLLLSGVLAWRMRGRGFALAVLALVAVAPTQLHMAHRALVDGFFGFLTLGTLAALWETLQRPAPAWTWPALYGGALALLVLTKENAAFVLVAIVALLIANRWFRFGTVSQPLIAATIAGSVAGAAILALCAGGFGPLVHVFSLDAAKSLQTPYAIATGDGPWFRYLVDLMLVSPAVMIFAIGGAFLLKREDEIDRAGWFLLGFILFSYVPMSNVTYGLNLRYANMWDFPLRYLALVPVFRWAAPGASVKGNALIVVLVGGLASSELLNYVDIFVLNPVYDPIPSALMRALDILKPLPGQ